MSQRKIRCTSRENYLSERTAQSYARAASSSVSYTPSQLYLHSPMRPKRASQRPCEWCRVTPRYLLAPLENPTLFLLNREIRSSTLPSTRKGISSK
eukprot:scaffold587_cov339-Pavlova_lutheri.AAC.80